MLLKKLRAFHEKTLERYRADMAKNHPAWMEDVMKIHQEAGLLFYVDEYTEERTGEEKQEGVILSLVGEIVRGRIKKNMGLRLYNAQGQVLAMAVALEDLLETGMDREAPYRKNTGRVRIRISGKDREKVMRALSMLTEE